MEDKYLLDKDPPMRDWTKICLDYLKFSVKENADLHYPKLANDVAKHQFQYGWESEKYLDLIQYWNIKLIDLIKRKLITEDQIDDDMESVPF